MAWRQAANYINTSYPALGHEDRQPIGTASSGKMAEADGTPFYHRPMNYMLDVSVKRADDVPLGKRCVIVVSPDRVAFNSPLESLKRCLHVTKNPTHLERLSAADDTSLPECLVSTP